MALKKVVTILLTIAIAIAELQYEIEAKNKAQKALAAKKEQMARSAYPGFDKDYFQKLSGINNTDRSRNRGKVNLSNLSIIHKMNQKHKAENPDQNMMNDNEGIAVNEMVETNDTTLATKIKQLRKDGVLAYEYINKNLAVPLVTGVYCDFENRTNSSGVDMCMWQWNSTVSSHGLGFQVMTAADVVRMNETTKGLTFNGPTTDADGNAGGHFLYLPVDPTMENMVIKSPPFRGLWEFCKFEVYLHQSKMANASIRLISESTMSEVQWILLEMTGNNHQVWQPMRFTIGKVLQEVRIMVEITRPRHVSLSQALPHIALDDIRMLQCLPEPPVREGGECPASQIKCNILTKESCIKQQQVCDLVRDCDDGSDEHHNCDKMPYGSYCNFEADDCGFENVPQPILKWSRHNGPTPTDKTGPNYDHTCGPPGLSPAPAQPPLSPAHINHSRACVGYYMFVNMNVTGPNKEKADFASTAVMNTVLFNPPPTVHGNISSSYYNCCMIRFYYQQNGRNYGSLSVDVVELTARGNITTALWFSTKDKGENWYKAEIFLPNITRKYYLQFKTRMGMRIYSDSAIDDFSLTPECFGLNIPSEELGDYNYYEPNFEKASEPHKDFKEATFYRFTTCGATGRLGPNQTQCDEAYSGTSASVSVVTQPPYHGIQAWTVPHEGLYTIIASGASGGLGAAWSGVSHGATVRGVFELHRHELLYMLVGQQGTGACRKTLSASDSPDCTRPLAGTSQAYTSKTHEVRNTHVQDGGGGGGGATFVFLMDHGGQAVPLIVAGGGGGVSTGAFRDDGSQHARSLTNTTPESGYMYGRPGETAGAGGGWLARPGPVTPGHEVVLGASLLAGGAGGHACHGRAHGGFGGGGGGCLRGGGGGGWRGGDTDQGSNGGGGWSYMDTTRAVPHLGAVSVAPHMSQGQVLVIPALHACDCDYRCVALNEFRSEVRCYCPATWNTDSQDSTKCILDDDWPRISWFVIIVLSVVVFIFALAVLCICLYLYNTYQRKKESEVQRKRLVEQELQLRRLRNPPSGTDGALTDFNPHYGSESFLPQGIDVRGLPQVSRESLKLVKALGQGAFGEVYQGLYRHRAGDTVEMPVAVKTLPELSTVQAESDFLMEAAIMAKFNHPNIVHLIGVCFDRHPRFIVLELLVGGDLKNFLRESRPRPERASALTMKDLLLCGLDVCKGCRYLEVKRFIHRDIAARNCLLTSRGPGRVVKIADFGMARDIYRADYYKKGGKAMLPIKWMPPEAYIDGVFTIKTDVWSFGVLLWEVFSLGVMPYTGCANREVMEMVSGGGRLERPYGCPLEIYRLMCECWKPSPADRPAFAHMFDRLSLFLADPEIVSMPLPVLRSLLPPMGDHSLHNGMPRPPPCDYLVPLSPSAAASPDSPPAVLHSKAPLGLPHPDQEDLQYQHLLKVSQDYGNIAPRGAAGAASGGDGAATCLHDVQTKFQTSNSTDRLLSAAEDLSMDDDPPSEIDDRPIVWETSFTEKPDIVRTAPGPAVDKLISITPTSPKPPENALSLAMESSVLDKTNQNPKNSLAPDRRSAPIASPDPPRINAWKEPPKLTPKPKPFSLDAAQLEQNLNALKKNSGSVNLTTMNILPPYINVVTPNKLSESKTIQIDPKKAVIHDLQSPKEETTVEEGKLKQSSSSGSLINGPMTDVPYADSDNTSSSSGSNPPNHLQNIQKSKQNNYSEVKVGKNKVTKQGSNGLNDSEISC